MHDLDLGGSTIVAVNENVGANIVQDISYVENHMPFKDNVTFNLRDGSFDMIV